MKRIILYLAILLTGCATTGGLSTIKGMKNEPDEFRGIKFASPLKNYPDMKIIYQDKKITKCVKKNENLNYKGFPMDQIYYVFYEGKFFEGEIIFKGIGLYNQLKQDLYNTYGITMEQKAENYRLASDLLSWQAQGPINIQNQHTWYGQNVYIKLQYGSGEGILIYQYLPILREIYKNRK